MERRYALAEAIVVTGQIAFAFPMHAECTSSEQEADSTVHLTAVIDKIKISAGETAEIVKIMTRLPSRPGTDPLVQEMAHGEDAHHLAMAVAIIFSTGQTDLRADDDDDEIEQPIQEVFQTDLVYPQEKGGVQVTLALRFHSGGRSKEWIVPLAIEYGLTDAWQVELEWEALKHLNPRREPNATGIGDLEIGTQYSFMNIAHAKFHVAVSFHILFPTGNINDDLTEGFIEYEPSLILAKDFPEPNNLQLFTQVGIGLVQRVKSPKDPNEKEPAAHEFILNVGFFLPFKLSFGTFAFTSEFNWRTNTWNNGGEENHRYYTPGLVWNVGNGWEIGLEAAIGLNKDADNYRIIGMLTYEFETQKGHAREVKKRSRTPKALFATVPARVGWDDIQTRLETRAVGVPVIDNRLGSRCPG
jgi:hypothetical protein